jgi:hypothetical protein
LVRTKGIGQAQVTATTEVEPGSRQWVLRRRAAPPKLFDRTRLGVADHLLVVSPEDRCALA